MRHLQHMRWALLLSALAFAPSTALAAASDGWHHNDIACEGTADTTVPNLDPMKTASWCPITTTTKIIKVTAIADCNWNADTSGSSAGTVTLTAKKCSGSTTAANDCKNTLTDSTGNTTITSGDPTGSFSLASGVWLVTASSTAANGRLLCTGR